MSLVCTFYVQLGLLSLAGRELLPSMSKGMSDEELPNALTWTKRSSGITVNLYGVAYGNGLFVQPSGTRCNIYFVGEIVPTLDGFLSTRLVLPNSGDR